MAASSEPNGGTREHKEPGSRSGAKEPKPAWKPFATALRSLLVKRGLQQQQLARRLGWSPSTFSEIVTTRRAPKEEEVEQLTRVLDAGDELIHLYKQISQDPGKSGGFSIEESRQISNALQPFLIRTEIRLSTLHRTAACLLGGAAIMLLLPLFFPAAPATLLGAVLHIGGVSTPAAVLLAVAMAIVFGLPIWGFILIVADLIGFFFTGHRFDLDAIDAEPTDANSSDEIDEIRQASGDAVFNPRLALPGLRAPAAEMPLAAYAKLASMRQDLLGVLLPVDADWRARFDDRMHRIFRLGPVEKPLEDTARLGYAFRLAASVPRTLLEETAKAELLLTKHILLLRIGQLRFFKTLLLVPVTVLTVILATSLVADDATVSGTGSPSRELVELIAVLLLWGPLAVGAVGSPNRWIFRMSPMSAGGTADKHRKPSVRQVYDDPRMVRFENGAVFLAMLSAILLLASAGSFIAAHPHSRYTPFLVVIALAAVVLWVVTKILWWKGYLLRTPAAFVRMLKVGAH